MLAQEGKYSGCMVPGSYIPVPLVHAKAERVELLICFVMDNLLMGLHRKKYANILGPQFDA